MISSKRPLSHLIIFTQTMINSMLRPVILLLCLLIPSLGQVDLDQEQRSQTATAITIIFDNSGSMAKNNKIHQAKDAFLAWLEGQDAATRFSLIHFTGGGKVAVPIGENSLPKVKRIVQRLQPNGGTPICNCLRLAHQRIQERRAAFSPYERHLVVVFTDGGESKDERGNEGVVAEIAQLTQDDIEVVGIGFHGQGAYMKASATQYYEAANTAELKKGLDKVAAEIDPNTEVELSPQEAELMQSLDLSKVQALPAGTDSGASTAGSSSGFSLTSLIPWAVGIFIVINIVRKILD